MNRVKSLCKNSEKIAGLIICIPVMIILFLCLAESFMHTMELRQTEEAFEKIILHSDNIMINITASVFMLLLVSFISSKTEKIPLAAQMIFMSAFVVFTGTLWIYSSRLHPSDDSFLVTNAGRLAAQNNYEFVSDDYFNSYPFQLGYVFFCEILIRIAGPDRYDLMYIQFLNVLMLAASYNTLVIIIRIISGSRKAASVAVISFVFCLQPVLYSSFLYGVIPGFTFSVLALLFEILFFRENKNIRFIYLFLSALFIGTAVTIKMNNYIFLIAVILTAAVSVLKKFRISSLIFIAAVLTAALTINPAVKNRYEKLGNTTLDPGVPIISYISMGLHYPENAAGCTAAGWYNGKYTIEVYERNSRDTQKVTEESWNQIKDRIRFFSGNLNECKDFFYEKTMSQWNEPTFSSLWLNTGRPHYGENAGKTAEYFCGKGAAGLTEVMNILQMMTYLGSLTAVVYALKNKKGILFCSVPLIVLGGFIYHTLAEGKSQYILPYYILLCGFSAIGTEILCRKLNDITRKVLSLKL